MIARAELTRLVVAAADGDRAAIDPLFHALWPVLVAYAARWLGDRALAEDCAQEALVRIFGQLDRFDRERDALTWALAITTWQARTLRRRMQRPPAPLEPVVLDGAALAEHRELVRAALAALDTLEPRDRDVIAAAIGDDDELRRTLQPATFRKRLERALSRLRTSWRSRHGTL